VPIIGGGPAGMSCALWLHNYGLRPVIVEQETALGGMARRSPYPNEWLLGQPDQSARQNAATFAGHVGKLAVETWLGSRPQRLRRKGDGFRLDVACPWPGRQVLVGTSSGDRDRHRISR
jgi:thioredoxin reductase